MTFGHLQVPAGPSEQYHASHDLLTWLEGKSKEFGSVYKASLYGTSVYVVSEPHYVEHILRKNWQNYRKGQAIKRVSLLLGSGLMVSEGEFWKSQRRMIQPAFHDKAIDGLSRVIRAANAALLQKWVNAARERASINITSDISQMTLSVVLSSIFGDDYDQVAPQFNILSKEAARDLQFAQAFRPLGKVVTEVATERRMQNRMGSDMLGVLMEARDQKTGQAMPDGQLVNEIMTLIVAGHETTASTLNWAWYLISKNSEVEERLTCELDTQGGIESSNLVDLPKYTFTRQVIEETLRLYPAGWLMTRKALKDDQLGNYFVPAGTEIYISPYLIQRNPALWEEPDAFMPDRFDPDRSQNRHELAMLPFSAGPRKCIGELLARVEMQIHVMMIAKHLRLRYASDKPMEIDAGVNLRGKCDFIMSPEIRRMDGMQ